MTRHKVPAKGRMMPVLMGAGMGLMMLWMVHGAVMSDSGVSLGAAIVFVGAHVLIAALLILGAVFGARLSPRLKGWIDRMHRPSFAHIGLMLTAAIVSAGVAHLFIHGGL